MKKSITQLNSPRAPRSLDASVAVRQWTPLLALSLLISVPEVAYGQQATAPKLSTAENVAKATPAPDAEPGTTFFEILHGNGTGTGYVLSHGSIVADSVRVYVGGQDKKAGRDYALDAATGTLYFTERVPTFSSVSVSYRYLTGEAAAKLKPAAPGLQFALNANTRLGLLFGQTSGNGTGFDTALHGLNLDSAWGKGNASRYSGLMYFSDVKPNTNLIMTLPDSFDAPAPTKQATGQDHLIAQSLNLQTGGARFRADLQDVGEKFGGFQALRLNNAGNQATLDQLKRLETQQGMKFSTFGVGLDFGGKHPVTATPKAGANGAAPANATASSLNLSGLNTPGLNFETRQIADKDGGIRRSLFALSGGGTQIAFTSRRADAQFTRWQNLTDDDKTLLALDIRRQFDPNAKADQVTAGDRDRLSKEAGLERNALASTFALGKKSAFTFREFSLADIAERKPDDKTPADVNRSLQRQTLGFQSGGLQFSVWKQRVGDAFSRLGDLSDLEKQNFANEHGLSREQTSLQWQVNKTARLLYTRFSVAGASDAIENAVAGAQKDNDANKDDASKQKNLTDVAQAAGAGAKRESLGVEFRGLKLLLNHADTDKTFTRAADLALPDGDKQTIEAERGFVRSDQTLHFDGIKGLVVDRFRLRASNIQDKLEREAERSSLTFAPIKPLQIAYTSDRDQTASDGKANGTSHSLLTASQTFGRLLTLKYGSERATTLDQGDTKTDTTTKTLHLETTANKPVGLNFDSKQLAYLDGKYDHTMNFNVHVKPVSTVTLTYTQSKSTRSWDEARDKKPDAPADGSGAIQAADSLDSHTDVTANTQGYDLQWQATKKFSVVLGTSQTDTNDENDSQTFTVGLTGQPSPNIDVSAKFHEVHDVAKNVNDVADVAISNSKPLTLGPITELTVKAGYASLNDKRRLQNETMTGRATWKLWRNQFTLDYGGLSKDKDGKTTETTISRSYQFETDPKPSRWLHAGFLYKLRTLVDGQDKLIRRFTADVRLSHHTRFTYLYGTLPEDDSGNIQPTQTAEVGLTHELRRGLNGRFFYSMKNDDGTKILTRSLGLGLEGQLSRHCKLNLMYSKDTNGFDNRYDRQERLRFGLDQQFSSTNFFSLSTELRTHDQAGLQDEVRGNFDMSVKF